MATTVEVLGIFTLLFFALIGVEGVLFIHLMQLETKAKKLITWIWKHGGFTSLNAMRAHYAKGGMPISHNDVLSVIEDVTELDKEDWSKERSLLTDNDAMNEKNMGIVLQSMNQKRSEAVKRKQIQNLYQQRNIVERAVQHCQTSYNGQVICGTGMK